jgi:hypothetical protein
MTTKFCSTAAVFGLLIGTAPALANPYDDCILQHMGTAQNKDAAYAIERACISKTSVVIPLEEVRNFEGGIRGNVGQFNVGSGYPEYGLLIEFKNTTKYDITENIITVINNENNKFTEYPVDRLSSVLPPGTWITGLGDPALGQIIPSGKTVTFFVHINEVASSDGDFWKKFSWSARPTKGIPPN